MNTFARVVAASLTLAAASTIAQPATLTGVVREGAGAQDPVAGARLTLFAPDLAVFHEARSGTDGSYTLANLSDGTFRVGCAARTYGYQEVEITISGDDAHDFLVLPETEPGRWDSVGTTEPEFLDATNIAVLLPDGRIFYCHDTTDPILFDPMRGTLEFASASPSEQGCMNGSLLPDGTVIFMGGQDGADPGSFRNAIPWVKRYDPAADEWYLLPDMLAPNGRWYPGLARLADGSFLVIGGGTAPDAERTETCERFDLDTYTWSDTGSMLTPAEFPPTALLHTGEVLATWFPPQLYDPGSGTWRATGNFVQADRWWPGHSDHSIVVLDDGRALALGIGGYGASGVMGEIYDPATESWSLTSTAALQRFQSEVVALPDGRILVAGGQTEASPPPVQSVLGIVRWSDLYDPALDTWRRVADMPTFREYHGLSLLLPDGRIAVTGGTRIQFSYGPTSAAIEAYSPPYLMRGVRPEITAIAGTHLRRGDPIELTIFPATAITSVVLMGTESHTHWVSGGVPRRLVLDVEQDAAVTAVLPSDPAVLPLGHYLLFAMVDDIPSNAVVVRVIDGSSAGVDGVSGLHTVFAAPNPTSGSTWLRLPDLVASDGAGALRGAPPLAAAPGGAPITAMLFDGAGRRVRELTVSWHLGPGELRMFWDGRDREGREVPGGVYWVRIDTPRARASGAVTVVR